jgi:hypothetical protein
MADNEGRMYFKLCFDADTLHWTIEEYMSAGDVAVHYESYSA